MDNDSKIYLQDITKQYLSSDFNGLPICLQNLDNDDRRIIRELIQDGLIDLHFGEIHPNPHIKATSLGSKGEQIKNIESDRYEFACAYPTSAHLGLVVDRSIYDCHPFTLRLALGEPALEFHAFDLDILESYRNDPRYLYTCDDISGNICISDRYYEDAAMREADKILLRGFGFCFDKNSTRAVAAYVRDLSQLSPEHQQKWETRRISGEFCLHPDFLARSWGQFPKGISVFSAFLKEQKLVNKMCERMGKPPLFRKIYVERDRPRYFGFLIRPTRHEYEHFVHSLDRLMSDNLNRKFFRGDVSLEDEIRQNDGRIEIRQKGTIKLLEDWLQRKFRTTYRNPINEMIDTFREVRKQRQKPAHTNSDDEFNQDFLHKQRDIMERAYHAINVLRQIFAQHSSNRDFNFNSHLDELVIRMY